MSTGNVLECSKCHAFIGVLDDLEWFSYLDAGLFPAVCFECDVDLSNVPPAIYAGLQPGERLYFSGADGAVEVVFEVSGGYTLVSVSHERAPVLGALSDVRCLSSSTYLHKTTKDGLFLGGEVVIPAWLLDPKKEVKG